MALPPWLSKGTKMREEEKDEPEHKGKSGTFEEQEKKAHGGKMPSKETEMKEPEHAKERGKASVKETYKKITGKK